VVQYVVEYAQDRAQHLGKNLSFSLVSNLTLMTEEKLTWLLDNGVDICTSLDGDEMSHNNSRT
jgi:sulfatase maturation enzyme AslB (radical SAM superfamily)